MSASQSSLSFCSLVLSSRLCAVSKVTVSDSNFANLVLSKQMDKLFTDRSPALDSGRPGKSV